MAETKPAKLDDKMEIKGNPSLPFIESFVERVRLQKSELDSDENINCMLEDLLFNVLTSFSKEFLMKMNNRELVPDEQAFVSTLIQTFSKGKNNNSVFANFNGHIEIEVKEFTKNNGDHYSEKCSEYLEKSQVIHEANEGKNTVDYILPQTAIQTIQDRMEDMDTEEFDEEDTPPVRPVKISYSATEISQTIQKVISKEINKITNPNLDDARSETPNVAKIDSDEISKIIIEGVKRRGADFVNLGTEEMCTDSMDRVLSMTNTFLAKHFIQSSLHCLVTELETQFFPESKDESKELMWSLIGSPDSLLLKYTGEKEEGANEISVFRNLKKIASGQTDFKQRLTDNLYIRITRIRMRHMLSKSAYRKKINQPFEGDLYSTIQGKVECFLALADSWLNTEVDSLSEKVILNVMETESIPIGLLPKVMMEKLKTEQDTTVQIDDYKAFVLSLVNKLVTKIFKKAKVPKFTELFERIKTTLFEKTWAEVKRTKFANSPKALKMCKKNIFKELRKKYGHATVLLVAIENPKDKNDIISCIKRHITEPKQPSRKLKFLPRICKAFTNLFKKSDAL